MITITQLCTKHFEIIPDGGRCSLCEEEKKKQKKYLKVIPFIRERVTKEDWEDAECSECDHVFGRKRGGEFAYTYGGRNHGGLQICQKCFKKLFENAK